jgi:hypothetical protein
MAAGPPMPAGTSCAETIADHMDKAAQTEKLNQAIAAAEAAYTRMYEVSGSEATACYNNAKESLHDAILLTTALGLTEQSDELRKRLEHVKRVFHSQFS